MATQAETQHPPGISEQTKRPTLADYLLNSLHRNGVRHIYGVPGDYVLRLDKRIEEHPIAFINTTREGTAGQMADAYARLKGLGVACITYGVGLEILNAVAQAYVEGSPLIVISGSVASRDFHRGIRHHHLIGRQADQIRDTAQLDLFRQITAGQAILDNPETAQGEIDRLIDLCKKEKKPVYLEIPYDRVDTPLDLSRGPSHLQPQHHDQELQKALEETVGLLEKGKKAVIWAGHEVQRRKLAQPLIAFAEKHNIPIATTQLGKGAISEHHPLSLGVYQGDLSRPEVIDYIDSCDVLLMLGVILTDLDTGFYTAKLAHERRLVAGFGKVEAGGKTMEHVGLDEFVRHLPTLPLAKKFTAPFPHVKAAKTEPMKPGAKITAKRIFECVQSVLKPDHILFADIGDCLFGSADLILGQDGFLSCAHFGSLGFATPGAIAAQMAIPERRVIALVGDGGFQMTAMELSTAARYRIDPIIIVFNNKGYATERPLLEGKYNDIQNWNYSEIPKVVAGGVGVRVDTEDGLQKALETALQKRGEFHLIEITLDKLDFSPALRRFEALVNKNGKP